MQPAPAEKHMNLMAESVVEAIRTGKPLQISSMGKSAGACGVFVGLEDSRLGVYTSRYADSDADGRSRETHVSLRDELQWTEVEPLLKQYSRSTGWPSSSNASRYRSSSSGRMYGSMTRQSCIHRLDDTPVSLAV